jgi:signal peptidase
MSRRSVRDPAWGQAGGVDADELGADEPIETERDTEPSGPPRRRGAAPQRLPPRSSGFSRALRRWRGSTEPGEEEDEEPETSPTRPPRRPVFFRARDSLYFEPLVALMIIVLVLVSLWAYTQNWPPVYVVESNSMQHGANDQVGLINTGDLVLAQKIAPDQIVTYFEGLQSGYTTYGEYGDVILYHPYGVTTPAPLIHRAILYLVWSPDGSYAAPSLASLPCSAASHPYYRAWFTPNGCGTTGLTGNLTLYNVGWRSLNVSIDFSVLGGHSGFLTMGDNNPVPDQPVLSPLVEDSWIVGVARGMIPWFGAAKLLLEGQASEVPPQSWQFMGLSLIGFVLAAMGIHYVLRAEGIEDERRKEEDEAREAEARARERARAEEPEEEGSEGGLRGWRARRHPAREADEEYAAREGRLASGRAAPISVARGSGSAVLTRSRLRKVRARRGRPRPAVRRAPLPPRHPHLRRRRDDSDAEL